MTIVVPGVVVAQIALVHAIFNGLTFAAAGTSAPHWQYGPFVPAMVDWILQFISNAKAA
jgi:hypothetical protein